jgi:arginyl-tRNA synthetase
LSAFLGQPNRAFKEDIDSDAHDIDLSLLGVSEQYHFYLQQSLCKLDSAPIANFAFDLAKVINQAYESERVAGGRQNFVRAFGHAIWRLQMCMTDLGMFCLQAV